MTNHTHLLLIPSDETGLAKALKPLHMRYSQHLNYRFNRTGLNWQGRFFSAPLDATHSLNALGALNGKAAIRKESRSSSK
jgi:putative transposase